MKGLLYLGAVLLVGAGFFRRFIAPHASEDRTLRTGALVGTVLVMTGSVLNLALTLKNTVGFVDPSFFWQYVRSSQHGAATVVRLTVTVGLAGVAWTALPKTLDRGLFVLGAVTFLASFSWVSHNASIGGWLPVIADVAHLMAACAWAGTILYLAVLPLWHDRTRPELMRAMDRASSVGLLSVLVLLVSGVYSSTLHIVQPAALTDSTYGRILIVKVALVLGILGIAAANRWYFLPALRKGGAVARFRRVVQCEALLLTAVLGVTGLLTTSPVPH